MVECIFDYKEPFDLKKAKLVAINFEEEPPHGGRSYMWCDRETEEIGNQRPLILGLESPESLVPLVPKFDIDIKKIELFSLALIFFLLVVLHDFWANN